MIDSCDDRERGVQLVTLSQNDVAMATSRNFQAFSRLIGDAGVGVVVLMALDVVAVC